MLDLLEFVRNCLEEGTEFFMLELRRVLHFNKQTKYITDLCLSARAFELLYGKID